MPHRFDACICDGVCSDRSEPHRQPTCRLILTAMCALFALPALGGCSMWAEMNGAQPQPAVQRTVLEGAVPLSPTHQAVVERQAVSVPTAKAGPPPAAYKVGPNDRLHLNVNGQVDLSTVVPGTIGNVLGARVDGNGEIQLPLVGRVKVGGMTTSEVQDMLVERYKQYIVEPWVLVEILEYRSQPVYLVGQFNEPGVIYLDRPTNVMQAVALGKGHNERAFLRGARLVRDDQVVPVDLYELLRNGAMDQNVWLWPEDTIYIPDSTEQQVFVLGDVGMPGAVDMMHGRLTLTQAIAQAEGFETVGSSLSQVRLIRSHSTTRGELIVIDLERILAGEALPFPLEPGDIVYIPRSKLGNWNDALREILPTIEVVTGLVSPFAQILSALEDDN